MNEIELLPCPFCGHDMNLQYESNPEDTIYPITREHDLWNVVCSTTSGGCDASMLGSSPERCFEKWNRRTPSE